MTTNRRFGIVAAIALCATLPAVARPQSVQSPAARAPYTVEFKTTHVQTLANGTTIRTETKEVMARDQQMRRMNAITEAPRGDHPAVTNYHVNDPQTGDEISWTSASNVVRDVRRPVSDARHGCWTTPDGRYRANYGGIANAGAPVQPLQPPPPPANASAPVASPLAASSNAPHFPTVTTGPDGRDITMISAKPAPFGSTPAAPVERNMTQQDLGADTIMGVQVRGSRTTITTPAGAAGNDQPLTSTNEIWMAPSLGMVLRSMSDDQRTGKTNREVVSIDLNPPNPALFQPPSDYKVDMEEMQPVACPQ